MLECPGKDAESGDPGALVATVSEQLHSEADGEEGFPRRVGVHECLIQLVPV